MRGPSIALALLLAIGLVGCTPADPEPEPQPGPSFPGTMQTLSGHAPNVLVNLPRGYAVTKQAGPDYDVFRVTQSDPGASAAHAGAVIYIGDHPQTPAMMGETVPDTVGGKPVQWTAWTDDSGLHHRELLLRDFFGGDTVVHVMIAGDDAATVGDLSEAMRSLRRQG